jgi:transposase
LELDDLLRKTLDEYLASYKEHSSKIERFDKRIEELAGDDDYKESVKKIILCRMCSLTGGFGLHAL